MTPKTVCFDSFCTKAALQWNKEAVVPTLAWHSHRYILLFDLLADGPVSTGFPQSVSVSIFVVDGALSSLPLRETRGSRKAPEMIHTAVATGRFRSGRV